MSDSKIVGMVGLGLMGTSFSTRLLDAGYSVIGFDPTADRCAEHVARGGTIAATPAEVAAAAPIVVLSLPNNDVGDAVCFGDGGIASCGSSDVVVVDTTTGHPDAAEAMAKGLADQGIRFMDVTISGNARQAQVGDLVTMVGGTAHDLEQVQPILDVIARSTHHVGPVGSGAQAKLVVNHILGVQRVVLAEGLTLGEKAGLDLDALLPLLQDSAAYSKAMDIWGRRMIENDLYPPGSRIRQSHKDFRVITGYARELGVSTVMADAVRTLLEEAEAGGLSDADNAAVVEVQRRRSGVGRIEAPESQ